MTLQIQNNGFLVDGVLTTFESISSIGIHGDKVVVLGKRYCLYLDYQLFTSPIFASANELYNQINTAMISYTSEFSIVKELCEKSKHFTHPQLAVRAQFTGSYSKSLNQFEAHPFMIDETVSFNEISFSLLSGAGTVGISIYKAGNLGTGLELAPLEIVKDINNNLFRVSSPVLPPNVVLINTPTVILTKGLYFFAINSNVNISIRSAGQAFVRYCYGSQNTSLFNVPTSRFTASLPFNITDFGLPNTPPLSLTKSHITETPIFGIRFL